MKARASAWVLSLAISLVLGILLGCGTNSRSVNAAKPPDAQPLFTPQAATLPQQKMCDEQAGKKFKEDGYGTANSQHIDSYLSRYDPTVNVCYMLVQSNGDPGDSVMVYNAFGGRVDADYVQMTNPQARTTCEIDIPGKPVENCNLGEDFDALTEKSSALRGRTFLPLNPDTHPMNTHAAATCGEKIPMKCVCKLSQGNQIVGLPDGLKPRFLSGLPKAALDSVLSVAKHRHFRASSVVIGEEDPAERLFLLTSGHGRHFVITSDGRKILLHWLTAGQIFGGAAILSIPSQYLANTEVLSDSCALVWERHTIRELATTFPVLLDNTLSIAVTENIAWSTAAHISLTSDDAQGRVAHLLVSLASAIGEATRDGVEVSVLNEDLAEGANVTPFTVSRCLRDWESAGILAKRRGKILLRKPELLLTAG